MMQRDVWSISLGRWFGVQVRLHMSFLLFGVFTIYLAWLSRLDHILPLAIASLVILFLSVLAHECAHCIAALRLGGATDSMVIGPLGGLRWARLDHNPSSELFAVMAGPLASFFLGVFSLILVAAYTGVTNAQSWNPISPSQLIGSQSHGSLDFITLARLSCWINLWLCILNLIPAFPFDGGRAVQAFVLTLRPDWNRELATAVTGIVARLVAIGLLVFAVVFRDSSPVMGIPTWLPLVLLAIFVFFSTRVEESQSSRPDHPDALLGYDFTAAYLSLEKPQERSAPTENIMARWWRKRQEARAVRRRETEMAEDERVDEILRRLHVDGIDNLSREERDLLRRVSARIRSKGNSLG